MATPDRDNSPGDDRASGPNAAAAAPRGRSRARGGRSGLSLRLRLMLMLLAVFGVIQVSMSVVHLLYVRRSANAVFNERLTAAAAAVAGRLQSAPPPLADALLAEVSAAEARASAFGRVVASVYDEDGRLVATTARPEVPLAAAGSLPAALAAAEPVVGQAVVPTLRQRGDGANRRARVVYLAFGGVDGRRHLLLVAAPDTVVRLLTDEFTWQIVLATPVGLLAAAVAGWMIAGVAVRPLRRLSQIAAQLRPDNLAQPIDFGSSASELTNLKSELDRMRRRLEAGYEAQERFVANVSHEIKTPIATVLTEAQLAARAPAVPPDVRQFVESTQDEMRRLGKLVESFLLLTRVRNGKPLASTTRRVAFNELVMDSVQHCWRFAEQHDVRIDPELAAEDDRDLAVGGDPELLRTLADNLIRNAVRYSPRGGRVRVIVRADGDVRVCLCVRDGGPNLPDALLARIFDRFAQAKTDEKVGRGSGLGLEIAQGIAELHGGGIGASNLPGAGCEFCATLPLLPTAPATPAPPTAAASPAGTTDQ